MTGLGSPSGSASDQAEDNAFATLLAAMPVFFGYDILLIEERLALRATCRGFRDAHDRAAYGFSLMPAERRCQAMLTHAQPFQSDPDPEAVRASISGFLSRGCQPRRVDMYLPWSPDAELAERQACAFLESATPAGSVTTVGISAFTPITPAVAAAVAGMGPRLTQLLITPEDAESPRNDYGPPPPGRLPPPPLKPAEQEAATVGAELLLQLVGPQLTKLSLHPDRSQRLFPRRALAALSHCTALEKLMLSCTWPADAAADGLAEEMRLLDTLSRLPSLRALDLSGGVPWLPPPSQRMGLAAQLEACLSRMTGLTSLKLHLYHLQHFHNHSHCFSREVPPSLVQQQIDLGLLGMRTEAAELRAAAEAEWRAVVSATRHMRNLVELRVPLQANAADLADLTTLTCLRVGALKLPAEAAAARFGGGDSRLPQYALPPALRRLETHSPLLMHVVASLQPSPPPRGKRPCSLIAGGRLWGQAETPWCHAFGWFTDVDEHGRLTSNAVAEANRAVSVLAQLTFRKRPLWEEDSIRSLQIVAYGTASTTSHTPALWPPLPPGEPAESDRPCSHVASWMGGLAALRLEGLALRCLVLPSRDILGIARCMPGLTSLDLCGSSYAVSSLALLAGMQRLKVLAVDSRDWDWPLLEMQADPLATYFGEQVVQSAFLALTLAPPQPDEARSRAAAEGRTAPRFAMPLPRLRRLVVEYEEGTPVEVLERALEAARQELAARGNGARLKLVPR